MTATELSDLLATAATEADVPGAVLAVQRDGVRTVIAHGVLNRRTLSPVTPDSLFQIGSISKSWTATMVVQLVQEGRLELDQSLASLLPGLPVAAREQITVRQLLTHSSGIDGDVFTDTGPGTDCVERYVATLGSAAQVFPPGAAYSYCNTGWVLLGRVIEVLDGRPWEESLRARLLQPLGLATTTVRAEQAILHGAAVGHGEDGSPVSVWQLPQSIAPAGLICQPVGELLDYVSAIHLDPTPDFAAMQQHHRSVGASDGGLTGIGWGWRRYDFGGRRLFGHDGSTVGQNAFLRVDPGARLVVALLTNSAHGDALWSRLAREVFRREVGVGPPEPPEPVPARLDDRHVGRYARAGVELEVTRDGDRLLLRYGVTGASLDFAEDPVHHYELRPLDHSGDRFVAHERAGDPGRLMSFGRLADGRAHHFGGGRVTPRIERGDHPT